jgi:putative hydrolase of the HAD superfamily
MCPAVVFDLDDTLYPERAYVDSGFRAVAAWVEQRLAVPASQTVDELRRLFRSGVRGNTFDIWLESRGDDAALALEMVGIYRAHEPEIAPYPGVHELLRRLGRGYRLAIVTDGDGAVQRKKLSRLGLGALLDVVVFTDDLGQSSWKPHPAAFTLVVARLGVEPADAVYVADNPTKDFFGARKAGLGTIRVRQPDGLYADLEPPTDKHVPDLEVARLADVEAAVERSRLTRRR